MGSEGMCRTEEFSYDLGGGIGVSVFRMTNMFGHYVECCNYGARIVEIAVPDRKGQLANVVLCYPELADYLRDPYYLGATIGPIANRISKGEYEIGGRHYILQCNDGCNCNHSGDIGLDRVFFSGRVDHDGSVVLYAEVPRSNAYSANISVSVRYSFSNADDLIIGYSVHADASCYINMTNHAYFNLSGGLDDITGHGFHTEARKFLAQDESFLPTGEIFPLSNLKSLTSTQPLGRIPRNTYYVFDGNSLHEASLWHDSSGRRMDVYTTQHGILLYSGFCLSEPYRPYAGVCLETQGFPDAPSHPEFPSIAIGRDGIYRQQTVYKFSTY